MIYRHIYNTIILQGQPLINFTNLWYNLHINMFLNLLAIYR